MEIDIKVEDTRLSDNANDFIKSNTDKDNNDRSECLTAVLKQKTGKENSINNAHLTSEDDKSTVILTQKKKTLNPNLLQTLISNLYLNAVDRIRVGSVLRCSADLAYCHQNHYRALLPNAPTFSVAKGLRAALLQKQYTTFFSIAEHMCMREVFPGDGIFTKLIEMLLVLCTKEMKLSELQEIYVETTNVFRLIVSTFPPCWRTLRPYYINLIVAPLYYTKPKTQRLKPDVESKKIVTLLFELLESTLEQCSEDDLKGNFVELDKSLDKTLENILDNAKPKADIMSMTTEVMDGYDWHNDQLCLQTFYEMEPGVRLTRIFTALQLILEVLEKDFVMWLLHHHKQPAKWLFCLESHPLLVPVFEIKEYTRETAIVKQLFKLFAQAAANGLDIERLEILERYISLLMEASNTAELKSTVIGYRYPVIGKLTQQLIRTFFKIFKQHNPINISNYITAIELLRQPYVRFEFINNFLQLFYFPHNGLFTPEKVAYELLKRRWQKYPQHIESNDELSREQYLDLLLSGLRAYCEWHGTQTFFQHMRNHKRLQPLQTVGDSQHRIVAGLGNRLLMENIEKDVDDFEKKLNSNFMLLRPQIDLPLMDILIDDETILKYRTDMKFMVILYEELPKEALTYAKEINFNKLLEFLQYFVGFQYNSAGHNNNDSNNSVSDVDDNLH